MITVIAGVNGAGKSSVAGSLIRNAGGEYYDPDEITARLLVTAPHLSLADANAQAWQQGYEQLRRAVEEDADFTLETTLGGSSIPQLLHEAIERGRMVRIFFVGLATPELHIERVKHRVARGGHPVPEEKIRKRWLSATHNMMSLIPKCTAVRVVDNSVPAEQNGARPRTLFSLEGDTFTSPLVNPMPEWAKPLASKAIERVTS